MTARPLRISYWTELYWPSLGGVEVFSRAFLPRLMSRGYDVDVISSSGAGWPDFDVMDGVPIHRLPMRDALERRDLELLADTASRLKEMTQAFQPDLIHLNFSGPMAFFAMRIATAMKIPLLSTIHISVSELPSGAGTLLGRVLEQSDRVIANSEASLEDVLAAAPGCAERASVLYHGVEVSQLEQTPDPENPPTILCIGRLVRVKGFDLAITALARIAEAVPDVRMVIAGDGDIRNELEAQVSDMGLNDRVSFLGTIDPAHVPALMRSATLVVMPSRWRESFGLVAIEAAFQERVVVGSRVGGIQETIDDGTTGLLVENENPDAIAEAVIGLLNDRNRLTRMGADARERAIRLFSMDETLNRYDALYREMVESAD
ncbi:MAG: glycosyltransferase family 4 protein [Alphaproteobacteria bacterium]